MRFEAVAIRDSKSELFTTPMFFPTKGQAIRAFSDAVNDPGTAFYKHPEDYSLYSVGAFDDSEGVLVPLALGPLVLMLGAAAFLGGE